MYRTAYRTMEEGSARCLRMREVEALARTVDLLRAARNAGIRTGTGIEAIYVANRVWAFLVEDLSLDDNELPAEVRADLISVGLRIIRQLEAARRGDLAALDEVIDLTELIKGALS